MDRPELIFHLARKDGLEFVFSTGRALSYPVHTHLSVYTVTVVRRGTVRLVRRDSVHVYPAGSTYVVAPREPHSPAYTDGFDIVSLCVDKNHFRTLPLPSLRDLCLSRMQALMGHGGLTPENAGALLDAVEEIGCSRPVDSGLVRPEFFAGPGAGPKPETSPFRFIRQFRNETGLTPHQFLVQSRVREAKKLLADGVPITEAALRAGFYDQSHCNRWFNRMIGITPRQYRDACFPLDP